MRYLIDTHTFLWMRHAPQRLGVRARKVCGDVDSDLALSIASAWELAVKLSIGKLTLNAPLAEVLREARTRVGISMLPIEEAHVLQVEHLPFHHRDPFDRLLAAQALHEGLTLVSRDPAFDAYDVQRIW